MAKTGLSDDEYFAIEDALLNSARGRAFLRMRDERQRVVSVDEARRIAASFREWTLKQISAAKETQSLDVLRAELQSMASHIQTAKNEIASIYNKDPKVQAAGNRINAATSELDMIVASTERATSDILNAAERIMEVAGTLPEDQGAAAQILTDQATEIFTACSFQDITGQRISKVVSTLRYIDQRVAAMVAIWGPETMAALQARSENADTRADSHLLNGPAMPGQGHTQDEIDALLAGAAAAKTNVVPPPAPPPATAPIKVAAEAPPPRPAAPPAPAPAMAAATASQADIDKLFD
jgi:chemotaxis regulatin CheY-phosphate phosphatase CheZ